MTIICGCISVFPRYGKARPRARDSSVSYETFLHLHLVSNSVPACREEYELVVYILFIGVITSEFTGEAQSSGSRASKARSCLVRLVKCIIASASGRCKSLVHQEYGSTARKSGVDLK